MLEVISNTGGEIPRGHCAAQLTARIEEQLHALAHRRADTYAKLHGSAPHLCRIYFVHASARVQQRSIHLPLRVADILHHGTSYLKDRTAVKHILPDCAHPAHAHTERRRRPILLRQA